MNDQTNTNSDAARRAFFDEFAAGWEARNYSPDHFAKLEKMVAAFQLKPGATVLDVGCGEGVLQPLLARGVGDSGKVVGLDASEAMLRGAAKKAYTLVLNAQAEAIPLMGESVDTVVCFAAFPHFSDKVKSASEFYRVLRYGGRAYVAHLMDRAALEKHHAKHHAVAGDHLPCPVGMRKIFEGAGFVRTQLDEAPGWYLFCAEKE